MFNMNPQGMMPPMANGNPIAALISAAQKSTNPMAMIQQRLASMPQNPQASVAMQTIQGKNGQQLRLIAQNMAKERGVDLEQFVRSMGLQMPK